MDKKAQRGLPWKWFGAGVLLAVLCAAGAVYLWLPGWADGAYNAVSASAPLASPEAEVLHRELFVADLHADTLLWPRPLLRENARGHVDVPRLRRGGIGLQVFAAPTVVRGSGKPHGFDLMLPFAIVNGWSTDTWWSPKERAMYMASRLDEAARASERRLLRVRSKEDLARLLERRAQDPDCIGAMLSIEGLHAIEGNLENLRVFWKSGFRILGLVHFFDNQLGGASWGHEAGGLTPFGRAALEFMDGLQFTVDLAHASEALFDDVLAATNRPVMVSHTGLRALKDDPRNLSDAQLRAVAKNGGVVGIFFWEAMHGQPGMAGIVEAILHAVEVAGEDHVALGSDFDGAITTPFDAASMPALTGALREAGLEPGTIGKILGGNVLRLLRHNLPPAAFSADSITRPTV